MVRRFVFTSCLRPTSALYRRLSTSHQTNVVIRLLLFVKAVLSPSTGWEVVSVSSQDHLWKPLFSMKTFFKYGQCKQPDGRIINDPHPSNTVRVSDDWFVALDWSVLSIPVWAHAYVFPRNTSFIERRRNFDVERWYADAFKHENQKGVPWSSREVKKPGVQVATQFPRRVELMAVC